MTYRRQADPGRDKAWKKWISENRDPLERIGLPLALYEDAARWEDFLENGHLHWHDGPPFDFGELRGGQMEQLCAFSNGAIQTSHLRCSAGYVSYSAKTRWSELRS